MTAAPLFPGFDGLMTLSRREGVDIRPTLLRVLTDLYVQASAHSADEERQFVELTSRLIEEVDDATRAAVRARLAIYPATPGGDNVGAGDTLMAGILTWLTDNGALAPDKLARLGEAELKAMLWYGAVAAGINCSRVGANPPTRAEVDEVLKTAQ